MVRAVTLSPETCRALDDILLHLVVFWFFFRSESLFKCFKLDLKCEVLLFCTVFNAEVLFISMFQYLNIQ